MINHDINYVVAGRGRPMSAGLIDTVQEILDTAAEYLDIEEQFEELADNDRISRELFESYQEALLDERIEGFFTVDRYVDSTREIIEWSGRDITNMTFAEVQQLVDDHVPLYNNKRLLDLAGLNPKNSSLEELEQVAYDGKALNFLYPLYRAAQAAEIMLEEGPEFFTAVGDAVASRGPGEAKDRILRGDLLGAAFWAVGHIVVVNTDAHRWIAGQLAVGDGVADVGQSILYGETHEVNPLARGAGGFYDIGLAWVGRKVGGKLSQGLRPTAGRLTGKLGETVLSNPVFHRTLSTSRLPILQNIDSTPLDIITGALSDGSSGLAIDQIVEKIIPSRAEVERVFDDALDNIIWSPDRVSNGVNHTPPVMSYVDRIVQGREWADYGHSYAEEGDFDRAVDAYCEALRTNPDLKGEIYSRGKPYEDAIERCLD